jgi:hypothetical protein
VALSVILLGLLLADQPHTYLEAKVHEAAPKQLPMTEAEKRDARFIIGTHYRTEPNGQWKPPFELDIGQFIGTHTVVLTPEGRTAWCGEGVAACTIVDAQQDFVDWWNANVADLDEMVDTIVPGECIMILPERDKTLPAYWFFLVGHEFAHCVYGNYHPGTTEAEALGTGR